MTHWHRSRVWKQDPTVAQIAVRPALIIGMQANSGPADERITTSLGAHTPVDHDENGDWLIDQHASPEAFDAVHTYTTVRRTLDMCERAIRVIDPSFTFVHAWGTNPPLTVEPHGAKMMNAYYSRSDKLLRFGYFDDPARPNKTVYTCRSYDVVAHEAGHWILDGLKPGWIFSDTPQTGGVHESFGDLAAIFTLLLQFDIVDEVMVECKGDLHDATFLAHVAEQFGNAVGRPSGLRNADNDLTLDDVTDEVHDISKVLTGAVYDIVAEYFKAELDAARYHPNESLYRSAQRVLGLLLNAIIEAPGVVVNYWHIASSMIDQETDIVRKGMIEHEFTRRGVMAGRTSLFNGNAKYHRCCGTLTRADS